MFSLSVVWRTFHAMPSDGRTGRRGNKGDPANVVGVKANKADGTFSRTSSMPAVHADFIYRRDMRLHPTYHRIIPLRLQRRSHPQPTLDNIA